LIDKQEIDQRYIQNRIELNLTIKAEVQGFLGEFGENNPI